MALLKATSRTTTGSHKAQALRAKAQIPAIIYGHGETPQAVTVDRLDIEKAIKHGERLMEVELEGKNQNVLIKEVQYDPMGSDVLHVDLARVNLDELVEVTVPVILRGTPAGATEGGVLQQNVSEVTIECQVRSIPDDIRVSIEQMKIGDKLYMKDLPLAAGSKLLEDLEAIVASVSIITEKEAAEGEEAAAPEVIGEKKEEGEEGQEK